MENIFSNLNLLKLIIKWKKHLFIILLIAVALSILFSCPWFIKPRYKSIAILYPSNLLPYSSETPTELMLQVFQSDDIRDSIIKKFDLTSHYKISKEKPHYLTAVIREFESNVDIRKTEYESVVIEILDIDPEIACKMVKEMINLFNKKCRSMQREKSEELLKIVEIQMNQKKAQIDSLQKIMFEMRNKYEILDYTVQTRESMKAYYKWVAVPGRGNIRQLLTTIQSLKAKGGDFVLTNDQFAAATVEYNKLKVEYETTLRDVTKKLTYTNFVTSPVPADKKTYPIRWLIVLVSSLAAFFITFLIILVIENYSAKGKISDTGA